MVTPQLKEQILKAIFRKLGGSTTKNISVRDIMVGFDHIPNDVFIEAVIELVHDGILFDRGNTFVTLTPDGWDRAEKLMSPPQTVTQNTLHIGQAHNSPIQQGIHAHQSQTVNYAMPSNAELQRLVELMAEHLGDLKLSPEDEKKARAQVATIQAQLLDEPNPTIVKEAGRTLKNVTEGAIGSLLATAAQPGIWTAVQSILSAIG